MTDDVFMRYYAFLSRFGSFDRIIEKKTMADFIPALEAHLAVDVDTDRISITQDIWTGKEILPVVKSGGKQIALIPISGPLAKVGVCGYGTSDYQRFLSLANASPDIHGVVLIIDSPGGTVDGSAEFATAVANSAKPVGVFADNELASAALWIASQASVIVANKNNPTAIGSIGALRVVHNYSNMIEKGNMPEVHIVTAPQSTEKVQFDPTKPWKEGDLDAMKEQARPYAAMIIDAVKAGRGDKLDHTTDGLFKGRMYPAPEAKAAGLIDSIGTLKTAINKVAELARAKAQTTTTKQGMNSNANMKFPKLSALFSGEAWSKAYSAFAAEDQAPLEAAEKKVADMEANASQLKAENEQLATQAKELQANVTALTAQVTTLEGEKKTLAAEKAELQKKLDAAPTTAQTTVLSDEEKNAQVNADQGASATKTSKYRTQADEEADRAVQAIYGNQQPKQ